MRHTIISAVALALTGFTVSADQVIASKSQRGSAYTANDAAAMTPPVTERETKNVSYSFPIKNMMQIDQSVKPAHIQSRQYSLDVTGKQLMSGVALNTSAKGALVRISAFDGKSVVEPKNLSLVNRKGTVFAQGKAFDTLVSSAAMQKNGVGFQRGTTGLKVADSLGAGTFTLKADQNINQNARYRINVFEKQSDMELHLTANKNSYLQDDVLNVDAKVFNQGKAQEIVTIKSKLVSPEGKTFKVNFKRSKDGYIINKPLDMSAHAVPGALWELHTEAKVKSSGQLIQRNGQLPFAFAEKTAKLSTAPTIVGQKQSPVAMIPVSVNQDGRYEVRAVLYGTDGAGQLKPLMMTHSAANLAAGEAMITMKFDSGIVARSGLSAPYDVKHLELRDQQQMVLLER
ncbi:DUF4785 domain-containing protein [Kangiella shandongensis]|uniref:DUF4785 domain-containing protein n=1 Tax=Kangiella shandongensis TaxID=2763258 RepID=UPI001CBD74F8|nr:DUF4785 domain-containing protein [Kangiella shandongensis]